MLILASNSPRRKELLAVGGWPFQVISAPVDERLWVGEPAVQYVRRLAETKARAVHFTLPVTADVWVVAADTAVVDGEAILGKPEDIPQARQMLRSLRGKAHQVLTGLAVLHPADGYLVSEVSVSQVWMRNYTEDELETYIASGDPMDKAGAYAIQHAQFNPVERLQGCYANVMGLPVCQLARMLAEFGVAASQQLAQTCQQTLDAPCEIYQVVLDGQK